MFRLSPTVKSLLIINVVIYVLSLMLSKLDLSGIMAMYRLDSQYFAPYQVFTYMFMHDTESFMHILFNMIGLMVFGPSLEMVWGRKKFLIFYLVTGIGAGLFYGSIGYIDSKGLKEDMRAYTVAPSVEGFSNLVNDHRKKFQRRYDIAKLYDFITEYEKNPEARKAESVAFVNDAQLVMITENGGRMVGASGAIYGILMAFGMMFPERQLMLLFPPIPIKAKYLVMILGAVALYLGFSQSSDGVAHFAHLGGMIFGFIMVKFFK